MPFDLESLLAERDVVWLDGPTGTELERRGFQTRLPSWTSDAAERAPDLLRQVHRDYLDAGADVVTANTFRTHPYTLRKLGRESDAAALTRTTVALARETCAAAKQGWVAGSIAPLEDCYRPELVPPSDVARREHAVHVRNLVDAGVDLLLVETMNTAREAHAAAEVALDSGLPVLVSVILAPDGTGDLLSGEDLEVAFAHLRAMEVGGRRIAGFLVNCTPASVIRAALARLDQPNDPRPIGGYPNAGHPDDKIGWAFDGTTPQQFAAWCRDARRLGASILGGCCGTTPEHLRAATHGLGT